MKELIEFIVKALVDDPSSINVTEVVGDKIIMYELRTAKTDIGKVIGKRGRTAGAIRNPVPPG